MDIRLALIAMFATVTIIGCSPEPEPSVISKLNPVAALDRITDKTERNRLRRQAIISRCFDGKSKLTILGETGYKLHNIENVLKNHFGEDKCPPDDRPTDWGSQE